MLSKKRSVLPAISPNVKTVFSPPTALTAISLKPRARVELAYLPFVRLLDRLPDDIGSDLSFAGLVEQAQKNIDLSPSVDSTLVFYPDECRLRAADNEIILTPVEASIYYLVLSAKKSCDKEKSCTDCHECFMSPFAFKSESILSFLEKRWGPWSGRLEKLRIRLTQQGDRREWFL